MNIKNNKSNYIKKSIYSLNRIVIVGDSRMSLMNSSRYELNIPSNYIFVAKSGAQIDWLEDYALHKTYKILKRKDSRYKYNVIFNLGVNDLIHYNEVDVKEKANDYFNMYLKLINYFDDVDFYFLSVNPIDQKFTKWEKADKNNRIEKFNTYIRRRIKNSNLSNVYYCNTYNNVSFNTFDGLHYTDETNTKIINYIDRNCIKSLIQYK